MNICFYQYLIYNCGTAFYLGSFLKLALRVALYMCEGHSGYITWAFARGLFVFAHSIFSFEGTKNNSRHAGTRGS